MVTKKCSKCKKDKPISDYNWRNETKDRRHSFCKDCHSLYRHNHYIENREKYLIKARKWNAGQKVILRKFIVDYLLKNHCVDCGETDIRTLDFDHEQKKTMGISQMVRNCHSVSSLEKEIVKCKIRCANCHRIKTFTRGNFWKNKIIQ